MITPEEEFDTVAAALKFAANNQYRFSIWLISEGHGGTICTVEKLEELRQKYNQKYNDLHHH